MLSLCQRTGTETGKYPYCFLRTHDTCKINSDKIEMFEMVNLIHFVWAKAQRNFSNYFIRHTNTLEVLL